MDRKNRHHLFRRFARCWFDIQDRGRIMHFLMTAMGSYGDVYPVAGLGAALRTRGHRVSVITTLIFKALSSLPNSNSCHWGRSEITSN